MANKQSTILKPNIAGKIKTSLPESWIRAAGLLKGKKINAVAWQRKIRKEWGVREDKLYKPHLVTISKREYGQLKGQSQAYKKLTSQIFSAVVKGSIDDVVDDFRKTSLYSKEFLTDFEKGLRKSSYGN